MPSVACLRPGDYGPNHLTDPGEPRLRWRPRPTGVILEARYLGGRPVTLMEEDDLLTRWENSSTDW